MLIQGKIIYNGRSFLDIYLNGEERINVNLGHFSGTIFYTIIEFLTIQSRVSISQLPSTSGMWSPDFLFVNLIIYQFKI